MFEIKLSDLKKFCIFYSITSARNGPVYAGIPYRNFFFSWILYTHLPIYASYPIGTGGPFPVGKARPGRDADHSLPSSAEVVNE
jgi:hypothetical protein